MMAGPVHSSIPASAGERAVLRNAADDPALLAAFRAGWHANAGLLYQSDAEIASDLENRLWQIERDRSHPEPHVWGIYSGYRSCMICGKRA